MNNPVIALTVFYCLGIVLAGFLEFSLWAVAAGGAVFLSAAALLRGKNKIFSALILILALFTGALNLKNSRLLPPDHISKFVDYHDNSLYSLTGFIDSQPELKDGRTQFIFRAGEIQKDGLKWRCRGKVLARLDFNRQLIYGDNLQLVGNLLRPYSFVKASGGYRDFLRRQGIHLTMRLKDPRQIIRLPGKSGSGLISAALWLRAKTEQVIYRYLNGLPAGILCAMVLGQKRGISRLVNNSFVRSGTVHILVVSGFNAGIVAFIANLIFKIIRIRRRPRILLTIICLLIYCLLTGASSPVARATVMGVIFLSSYFFKRDADIYNSLAIAALIILAVSPGEIFDLGFQLSFVSVLAIVSLYPRLKAITGLNSYKNRVWRFIGQGCLVSFSAWLGTAGIIAGNFGIVAPVTVLANIFIVPLASLITLCGFTLVFSGLLFPQLASLIAIPVSALINLLLNINSLIIKLPFAYFYL